MQELILNISYYHCKYIRIYNSRFLPTSNIFLSIDRQTQHENQNKVLHEDVNVSMGISSVYTLPVVHKSVVN